MYWKRLEHLFEERERASDWDASRRFEYSTRSRQLWELVGDHGFEEALALGQMHSQAGRPLHSIAHGPKKRVAPKKLFSGTPSTAEAWLKTLCHLRIDLQQNPESRGLRREERLIIGFAHASTRLCGRLRVHRSRVARPPRRGLGANSGGRHLEISPDLRDSRSHLKSESGCTHRGRR